MLIDLHCHTQKTKREETLRRSVTKDKFKTKVELAGVKMIGITNHNSFDYNNYLELKEVVKDFCYVMPGVELDVKGQVNGSTGHVIVVTSPKNAAEFNRIVNRLINKRSADKVIIDASKLIDSFSNLETIYIAHCMKNHELSEDDLNKFCDSLKNKRRFFREPSSVMSIGVLQSNNHKAIIGSDVQDWDKYEKCKFGELKFEIKDFEHLIKFVDKDETIINDYINKSLDGNITVYGDFDKLEYPFTIPIYYDTNIIFGDKGSGKTEIIRSLERFYTLRNNKVAIYYGGREEKWSEEVKEVNNGEYNISNIGLSNNLADEYERIVNYCDIEPTPIKNYIKYVDLSSNNKNKQRMKCLNMAKTNSFSDAMYIKYFEDSLELDYFMKKAENFAIMSTHQKEFSKLITAIKSIDGIIKQEYKKIWVKENANRMVDDFISNMNKNVSENTGQPVQPTETGLVRFVKNRISLKNNCKTILDRLKTTSEYSEYVGGLGEKGKVCITTRYSFLNRNNFGVSHKTLLKPKTELKNIVINLEKISEGILSKNIPSFVEDIRIASLEKDIQNITDFMSISKEFTINKKEYKPSKGELAILALQHGLLNKDDCDVFLADEPELNLGSMYINNQIIPLINNVAKSKKIVVVATHDANIAIRTRPLQTILKITDDGKYETYIGNMFSGTLVGVNTNKSLDWKTESIKYLEGGKEAFEERTDLYE